MALSQLINDTAQLLNDPNFSFTSRAQIIRWINESRRHCAKRTGCVRRLITGQSAFGASAQPGFAIPGAMQPGALPNAFSQAGIPSGGGGGGSSSGGDFSDDFSDDFSIGSGSSGSGGTFVFGPMVTGAVLNNVMTIPNVERYPYVGFWNPALQAQYAGCDKVIDSLALSVNWGGVTRPTLDWMPWDNLQAYARAYAVLNTSYPSVWSVYNDGPQGEIWIFPLPSQQGEMELDATCTPKPIYSDDDYDVIPDGMQEALKFGAASLQFMSRGRYSQAQVMESLFAENMGVARVAFDRGKTNSYYWNVP